MIFQNFKPKSKEVYIKELDASVQIREVTYPVYKQVLALREKKDFSEVMTLLLLNCVYKDDKRVFQSEKDLDQLPAHIAELLFVESTALFNQAEDDTELKKS